MSNEACRIVFQSNLPQLSNEIDQKINQWLEESSGELESRVKALSRVDTGQTKGSYQHVVDTSKKEARVGSSLQNAIWEEYGTGEYALNGNGRKGWWVYVKGTSGEYRSSVPRKYYTREQALRIMAYLRSKGLDAYATCGKTPNRPIFRAFSESEDKIIRRLEQILNEP